MKSLLSLIAVLGFASASWAQGTLECAGTVSMSGGDNFEHLEDKSTSWKPTPNRAGFVTTNLAFESKSDISITADITTNGLDQSFMNIFVLDRSSGLVSHLIAERHGRLMMKFPEKMDFKGEAIDTVTFGCSLN